MGEAKRRGARDERIRLARQQRDADVAAMREVLADPCPWCGGTATHIFVDGDDYVAGCRDCLTRALKAAGKSGALYWFADGEPRAEQ